MESSMQGIQLGQIFHCNPKIILCQTIRIKVGKSTLPQRCHFHYVMTYEKRNSRKQRIQAIHISHCYLKTYKLKLCGLRLRWDLFVARLQNAWPYQGNASNLSIPVFLNLLILAPKKSIWHGKVHNDISNYPVTLLWHSQIIYNNKIRCSITLLPSLIPRRLDTSKRHPVNTEVQPCFHYIKGQRLCMDKKQRCSISENKDAISLRN